MPAPIQPTATLVNTNTVGDELAPRMARLADGGWVIIWSGRETVASAAGDFGVFGQRYDASGGPIGSEFLISSSTPGQSEYDPDIVALPDGGWIVAWQSVPAPFTGVGSTLVYTRRYDAAGNASPEVQVHAPDGYPHGELPVITVLADGGWVVVLHSIRAGGAGIDLYAYRYDATGAPLGLPFRINTSTASDQHTASISAIGDGGWVAAWQSQGQDSSGAGVYSQRYDAVGNPVGGETLVNSTVAGDQAHPSVAALADGGWIVVWMSDGVDGSGSGIVSQRYDASGALFGAQTLLNGVLTAGDQGYPTVIAMPDGGYVVRWLSHDGVSAPTGARQMGVYIQRFDANGVILGPPAIRIGTTTEDDLYATAVAPTANGWIAAWAPFGSDGSGHGIYALTSIALPPPINVINGTPGNDTLLGTPGDDQINGFGGNDLLVGFAGNDILNGGDGIDVLLGGLGNDTLAGGDGSDWAIYADAPGAVEVDLETGSATGANGNDTLIDMENVVGSAFDDVIIGDAGDNFINGLAGDDFVLAGHGNDNVDGGDGDDGLNGNQGDDYLIGGNGHDNLSGQQGNDILEGGAGDDLLRGGSGDDIMDGGAGLDRAAFFPVGLDMPAGGVTVSLLLQGVAQDTGHGWDTLIGIEHISGTALSDTMTGDGGDNWLRGAGGGDTISGGSGDDLVEAADGDNLLDGGDGVDTASFAPGVASGPVNVSLALQEGAQSTGIGSMTLTNFENLSGTTFDDTLSGDAGANLLAGDAGNDTLNGGDGNDILYGDGAVAIDFPEGVGTSGPIAIFANRASGNDALNGGKGDDLLLGGGGDDLLTGGQGDDTFAFSDGSGDDVITDFKKKDMIVIEAAGVDEFADLTIGTNANGDAVISWGTGDSITLEDYKAEKLSADDFNFGGATAATLSAADMGWIGGSAPSELLGAAGWLY